MANLSILIAFTAGLLSFFSPCVLPLIPAYILYISGISLKEYQATRFQTKSFKHSLVFIAGFSLIFILLGATASLIGQVLIQFRELIRIVGGSVIILLGLYIMGVLKLPWLEREKRLDLKIKPTTYWGTFLVGVTFAVAWVPCVGPILAAILFLASTAATFWAGMGYLLAYSAGLAVPFLITTLVLSSALRFFKRIERQMKMITIVSGIFLVIVGLLILTNYFQAIITYIS